MSTEKQQTFSSTKDLKRTLGKKELMGIAIGQIIGAGIMSMMGVAIAMTGRSANLAFMLSAVFTMCTFFPSIFITSCIRMRGGMYTQFAIFAGDKWAGYYSVVYFITNMSLAMYALSFAQYAIALLPSGGSEKVIALIVGTAFFVLNYFGGHHLLYPQLLRRGPDGQDPEPAGCCTGSLAVHVRRIRPASC